MTESTRLAIGCDINTRRIYVGECANNATHLTLGTDITDQALAAVLAHIGIGYEVEVMDHTGRVVGVLSASRPHAKSH
jgi:hypothetical protein